MGTEGRRSRLAWLRARTGTVQMRTTLAATLAVGAAMVIGSLLLVLFLRDSLLDQVRQAAEVRADEVATMLQAGARPGTLIVDDDEDALIQVLDEVGRVVASSPNVAGDPAVDRPPDGASAEIRVPFENEPFLAVATAAETPDGHFTIVVARTTDVVGDAIRLLTGLLAAGLPLLLFMVALTTWKATGRALRPVESIRGMVEEISAAELHRRVPDPPGDDEINRLARTMNRMLDRLEQAQTRQRRLVSDASHELRSPVASILQHAEVALAHPDRTATGALAETVRAEGLRVQQLIEDLLVLARADEHTLQLRRRPLDLDDLVFEEARRLRQVTDLRINTTAVSAGRVSGDAASLRRVLRNLGDNAARHARGRVSFAVSQQDSTVVFRVEDDGPGIPEAERERVLERFVRLDDARARDAGGSGLGLALVAELVAAHGGSVAIAAGAMGGAQVELRLPSAEG